MKLRKVLCGLFAAILCLTGFLGNVEAKDTSVIKLSLGKKHSSKNIEKGYFDPIYYSFTLSKTSVVNIKFKITDDEIKDRYTTSEFYVISEEDFLLKDDGGFVYYGLDGLKYKSGVLSLNDSIVLPKGTFYFRLNIDVTNVDSLEVTVNTDSVSKYDVNTIKYSFPNLPKSTTKFNETLRYIDGHKIPIIFTGNIDLEGYYITDLDSFSYYRKNDGKWLYRDLDSKDYVWLTAKYANKNIDRYIRFYSCNLLSFPEGYRDCLKGNSDILVKTNWKPIKYSIKYHNNGGSGSMKASTFTYDKTGTLRTNTFKHKTKKFSGWKVKSMDKYGETIWYYTNGKKSEWYRQGEQPKGWTKKVISNKAKVKNLVYTLDCHEDTYTLYNDVHLYAVWK